MQIRIFTVDENGFIKIRPDDFELLLNDAYMDGYNRNALTIGFQEPKEPPKNEVYPTWYRWLIMMGAVSSVKDLFSDLQRPIPADIAEKFGIKPKEG